MLSMYSFFNQQPFLPFRHSIDSCEFGFFAKDLLRQVEFHKPDDVIDFSVNYLKCVQSYNHVMGTNYSYVLESTHNRKALVFGIMEAFRGFDQDSEMSVSEFHFLVEALCIGFPKSLVLHAVTSTTEHSKGIALSSDSRYPISSLCRAVYCHILFDEWLKIVEDLFRAEGGKNQIIECGKLRSMMEDFHRKLPKALHQPPLSAIVYVLDAHSTGSRGHQDVSLDKFRREVFFSAPISVELNTISNIEKY